MKRYEHIDISKGIGILLVVFFHLPGVNRLIYFNNWGGGGGDYNLLYATILYPEWIVL